jgi:RimJ/RimL family protein N-acetyltransferase
MTHWIPYPTTLHGETVELLSLDKTHYSALTELARDKRIWEYYTFDGTHSDRLSEILDSTIADREKGSQFPFVIYHKREGKIVGNTRLMEIQPQHKKLEIGGTWLHPDYWATEVNLECKLILFGFCFEQLGAFRVQLRTDENNIRSRKAIQKVGGQFEGILRHDMVRDNGTKRNSAYFSIIDTEWPQVKFSLAERYRIKKLSTRI